MPPRADHYSWAELEARLAPRATELCAWLFPRYVRRGNQLWLSNPRRSDPNMTSFSFNLLTGVWKDFSDASGEAAGKGCMSLIAMFACGGDNKHAIVWAKDWLGLTGRSPDPAESKKLEERRQADDARATAEALAKRKAARGLFLSGTPLTTTDPASFYLRHRGIDLTKLRGVPRALRYHPEVYASDPEAALRGPWPAMLAAIARFGEGVVAVHRTYLRFVATRESEDALWDTRYEKRTWANCKTGKQVKGAYAGGYIALSRGASGKPLREAPDGEWVQIAEGIEDALTAALVKPELRTLAAVSLSNIGGLKLPPQIKGAYILAQNDDEPAARAQFDRAMDQLAERGIEPAVVRMPANFKDINDMLVGKEKAA